MDISWANLLLLFCSAVIFNLGAPPPVLSASISSPSHDWLAECMSVCYVIINVRLSYSTTEYGSDKRAPSKVVLFRIRDERYGCNSGSERHESFKWMMEEENPLRRRGEWLAIFWSHRYVCTWRLQLSQSIIRSATRNTIFNERPWLAKFQVQVSVFKLYQFLIGLWQAWTLTRRSTHSTHHHISTIARLSPPITWHSTLWKWEIRSLLFSPLPLHLVNNRIGTELIGICFN